MNFIMYHIIHNLYLSDKMDCVSMPNMLLLHSDIIKIFNLQYWKSNTLSYICEFVRKCRGRRIHVQIIYYAKYKQNHQNCETKDYKYELWDMRQKTVQATSDTVVHMTTNINCNRSLMVRLWKPGTYTVVLTRHNETRVKVNSETCDVLGGIGRVVMQSLALP